MMSRTSSGPQPSPLADQRGVHPAIPLRVIGLLEHRRDDSGQAPATLDGRRVGSITSLVITEVEISTPTRIFTIGNIPLRHAERMRDLSYP
jgi:hypothetical protein